MCLIVLFCCLIASIGIGVLYVGLKRRLNYWVGKGVPGPKPKWTGCNLSVCGNGTRNLAYELDEVYREYKQHPYIGLLNRYQPEILAISPEIIKTVLVKNFKNFHDNAVCDVLDRVSDPILGQNLASLVGDEWREKRTDMVQAVSLGRIKAMTPIFEEVVNHMISYIRSEMASSGNSNSFEARELSSKYTSDVLANCIFGLEGSAYSEFHDDTLRRMGTKILAPTSTIPIVYSAIRSVFPYIKHVWNVPAVATPVESYFVDLAGKAIHLRRKHKIVRETILAHLCSVATKHHRNLDEREIAGYGVTFFLEGFEKTSTLIAHLFYQLGRNRIAQQKLYREIEEVAEHAYDDVMALPYLDQIVHETLRLSSAPRAQLMKKCTNAFELDDGKGHVITVDRGTVVRIPLYSMHRDKEFWMEPDKFIPERFDAAHGGVKQYRDRGVFYPFGDGPRICVGMRFAMTQVKLAVVAVVRNFELSVNRKTKQPVVWELNSNATETEGGIWIDFKSRSH